MNILNGEHYVNDNNQLLYVLEQSMPFLLQMSRITDIISYDLYPDY